MSSDETQSALSRAYDLVEAGNYDEARAILEPILADNRDNADAWWIYAHAVTSPDEGQHALENVLRINPSYPDAAELLAQARSVGTEPPEIVPLAPATMPEAPPSLPEEDFADFPETVRATGEQPAAPARRSGLPLIPILAVVVIVVLVLLVILSQGGGSVASTPTATAPQIAEVATATELIGQAVVTSEAVQATSEPEVPTLVSTPVAALTEQATSETTAEVSSADYSAIQSAMSSFSLPQNGIAEVQTSLGNTLQVTACTTQGRAMRMLLPQVMNALAKQSDSLGSSIQALGVHLINCGQNSPLLTVATDLASAQSYAQGKLSDSEFAATWKPQ